MTRMAAVFTLLSCMASASALAACNCPFPQGMHASIAASKQAIAPIFSVGLPDTTVAG